MTGVGFRYEQCRHHEHGIAQQLQTRSTVIIESAPTGVTLGQFRRKSVADAGQALGQFQR